MAVKTFSEIEIITDSGKLDYDILISYSFTSDTDFNYKEWYTLEVEKISDDCFIADVYDSSEAYQKEFSTEEEAIKHIEERIKQIKSRTEIW